MIECVNAVGCTRHNRWPLSGADQCVMCSSNVEAGTIPFREQQFLHGDITRFPIEYNTRLMYADGKFSLFFLPSTTCTLTIESIQTIEYRLWSSELWTISSTVSPSRYLSRHNIHNAPKLHRNVTIVAWKRWNRSQDLGGIALNVCARFGDGKFPIHFLLPLKFICVTSAAAAAAAATVFCCRCCATLHLFIGLCPLDFIHIQLSLFQNSNSCTKHNSRRKLIDSPRFIQNCNSILLCSSTMSHTQLEW